MLQIHLVFILASIYYRKSHYVISLSYKNILPHINLTPIVCTDYKVKTHLYSPKLTIKLLEDYTSFFRQLIESKLMKRPGSDVILQHLNRDC